MAMLRENPDVSFGLHLSVICDVPGYRYGPVAPAGGMEPPLAKRVPAPRQGDKGAPPAWPDHRTGPDQ
jgi:hypothetical protein